MNVINKIWTIFILITSTISISSQVRTSVVTGNWNVASTWDCNCVPAPNEDAVIASGTTVTMTNNESINSITVNTGGTLDNGGNDLTTTGNLLFDGIVLGRGDIFVDGINVTMSGTGTLTDVKRIEINNGNVTILPSSNLTLMRADIRINGPFTVTNQGTITVAKKIKGNSAASTWINDVNATLNAGRDIFKNNGTLVASATGNTVNYTRAKGQKITQPQGGVYWNLGITNGDIKTVQGPLTVNGNFTNNYSVLDLNGFNVSVAGNWTSTYGSLIAGTQTVTFNGTANQTVSATSPQSFFDVVVNKSTGSLNINVNDTITNSLTMTSGNIVTGSNSLTLGTSLLNPGTLNYTSGTIVGTLNRWITNIGVPYQFPIGTASNTRSASVSFNTLTGGMLSLTFVPSFPTNSGLPLLDVPDSVFNTFTEGYWDLSGSNGLVSADYNISLSGNGFTSFPVNASSRILTRPNSTSTWIPNGLFIPTTGVTATRNNISLLDAQFAFGDTTSCYSTPIAISVLGADSICTSSVGEIYTIANNPGSSYIWTIVGGTQASGGATNNITVNWGTTGMIGAVSVQENTGCSFGTPASLNVNIHTLPTSPISGKIDVAQFSTNEVYNITKRVGYTYTWTVTGGAIVSGQGTDSVFIDWGAVGNGTVSVIGNTSCGASAAQNISVTIYKTINSIVSGNWDVPSTWDCNCIPNKSSNVIINNTHTVMSVARIDVNHVTVNTGGIFDDGGNRARIYGNLLINGIVQGTNRLELRGTNSTLDGTGSFIGHTGELRIRGGLKTILPTANLNMPTTLVKIDRSSIALNQGTMTIGLDLLGRRPTTSTWINSANATLNIGGVLLATGTLEATEVGNIVNYNGNVAQDIKTPSNSQYYHLQITGTSAKNMLTPLDVNGDITISSSLTSSNFNLNLAGNWTNSGVFTSGTNLITFDGTTPQIITNLIGENFNDATILSGSEINISNASIVSINNILTNTGTITNDGSTTFVLGYSGQTGVLQGDGNHILTNGNWNLTTGTFNYGLSTVSFNGVAAQTIQGPTTFYNVSVNNVAGVSILTGLHQLKNIMTLTNGIFNTSNSLTLLSDVAGTASIAEIQPTADLIGSIIMQRYIAPAPTSWRFLSSACSGQTLADWNDNIITSGFPGSDFPSFPFTSIYRYNETDAAPDKNSALSFTAPTNITDPILVNEGYWLYVGPVALTFDVNGPINKFSQTLNVTWTNSGSVIDDGWCIVPNPYPCAIDWDSPTGWTKTNLNNATYIWNPASQQYASYVGGIGVNGGSRYIPSQQAFYVQTNAAAPSLIVNETAKAPLQQPTYKSTSQNVPSLRLTVVGNNKIDETVIRFIEGASNGFEAAIDASKFNSFEPTAPSLSSVSDSLDFAINSLPSLTSDLALPIRLRVGVSGNYTFNFNELNFLPSSSCIVFEDKLTNTFTNIRTDSSYNFTISDTTTLPRFILHISKPFDVNPSDLSCFESNDGVIIAKGTGTGPWNYKWKDATDSIIQSSTGIFTADTLGNLPKGDYKILISGNSGFCVSGMEEVEIAEPSPISVNINKTNISCFGKNNGTAIASITGGVNQYSYLWSNGNTNAALSNLQAGKYSLLTIDSNGCTARDSVIIDEPVEMISSISSTLNSGDCDGTSTINMSGGAEEYTYVWSNGATTNFANGLCNGTHIITITDKNGCSILDSVKISSIQISSIALSVYPNPNDGNFSMQITSPSNQNIQIIISDVAGKFVYNKNVSINKASNNINLNLEYLSVGIYQVKILSQEENIVKKITIDK